MPELRLREVRLPELSLPEMSRDDIVRAIGDVRRDIDIPEVDLRGMDLPKIDLSKVVTTAAQAAGLVRRQRPRLPIVAAGAVAVAAIGFALLMSPAVRPRLTEAARRWRERLEARRAERAEDLAKPIPAIPVAPEGAPVVEAEPFATMPIPATTPSDEPAPV